ncbi:hypothetical protein D9M69_704380 [compost metagenome]
MRAGQDRLAVVRAELDSAWLEVVRQDRLNAQAQGGAIGVLGHVVDAGGVLAVRIQTHEHAYPTSLLQVEDPHHGGEQLVVPCDQQLIPGVIAEDA